MPDFLSSMDSETFQQLIDSGIEQLEKKPMSIREQANKFKGFIFEHNSDFQRDEKTIKALKSLEQSKTVKLLENTIEENTRKMVNLLMFAEQHQNLTGEQSTFDDLSNWKITQVYQ